MLLTIKGKVTIEHLRRVNNLEIVAIKSVKETKNMEKLMNRIKVPVEAGDHK